LTEL
jgi:hypothetical protein